jgi:hypothetical protein
MPILTELFSYLSSRDSKLQLRYLQDQATFWIASGKLPVLNITSGYQVRTTQYSYRIFFLATGALEQPAASSLARAALPRFLLCFSALSNTFVSFVETAGGVMCFLEADFLDFAELT